MEKSVVELFAGVGGFRVGLNKIEKIDENGHAIENPNFKFVWSNQWEPSTRVQHAFDCYNLRFNESNNNNLDIHKVDKKTIPDHSLLCGGFPCQDYSVARTIASEKGIEGKKGVLWWDINDILKVKRPPFVLLENVDRLLKSPSSQRGRDFGIMLRCFNKLGYSVEWRVINAAEYGFPQRRRRIYIFAYLNNTNYAKSYFDRHYRYKNIVIRDGVFAKEFEIDSYEKENMSDKLLDYKDILELSDNFKFNFQNAGFMRNGRIYTFKVHAKIKDIKPLNDIVEKGKVDKSLFLTKSQKAKFKYLRDSKSIPRVKPNGETYNYSEGKMSDYDSLLLPGRTMLTSEGTVNRSSHIIKDVKTGKMRILSPVECERLNQFPDGWTDTMPTKKRYFMMGNALVCGVISLIGNSISKIIESEE